MACLRKWGWNGLTNVNALEAPPSEAAANTRHRMID